MSAILAAAMIHFSIPLNATADQVEDVIGIIKDTFNYVAPGEIDPPGTLPPGQTAAVASAATTVTVLPDGAPFTVVQCMMPLSASRERCSLPSEIR